MKDEYTKQGTPKKRYSVYLFGVLLAVAMVLSCTILIITDSEDVAAADVDDVDSFEDLLLALDQAENGDRITLSGSFDVTGTFTVPAGVTLVISPGVTLTISNSATVVNNGYLDVRGTLSGNSTTTLTNNGTIYQRGTITGAADDDRFAVGGSIRLSEDDSYHATVNVTGDVTFRYLNLTLTSMIGWELSTDSGAPDRSATVNDLNLKFSYCTVTSDLYDSTLRLPEVGRVALTVEHSSFTNTDTDYQDMRCFMIGTKNDDYGSTVSITDSTFTNYQRVLQAGNVVNLTMDANEITPHQTNKTNKPSIQVNGEIEGLVVSITDTTLINNDTINGGSKKPFFFFHETTDCTIESFTVDKDVYTDDGGAPSITVPAGKTFTIPTGSAFYLGYGDQAAVFTNNGTLSVGGEAIFQLGANASFDSSTGAVTFDTGYHFINWNASADGTGAIASQNVTYANSTAAPVYMIWSNVYTVTLNLNGGEVVTGNVTSYTYGVGATLPTQVAKERTATTTYTFDGWYANSGLTGDPVLTIAADATGDKEYWAKWIEAGRVYEVTLNLNGGQVDSGNVSEYRYGVGATLPTEVSKDRTETVVYTFGGWYANSGLTGDPVLTIAADATGDKEY